MTNQSDDKSFATLQHQVAAEHHRADRYQYLAHMLQIPFLWEQGRYDLVRALLDRAPHTQDDFAWDYWRHRTASDPLVLRGPDRRINAIDFSPDGQRVIIGYESGCAVVWDLAARQAICNLHPAAGTSLVAGKDEPLTYMVLHPDQVPENADLSDHMNKSSSAVHGVGFLPDGNRVWTLTHQGDLVLWHVATGECLGVPDFWPILRDPVRPLSIMAAVRSSDRQRALFGGYDGLAWIVDLLSGAILYTLQGHEHCISTVSWSYDGMQAATGSWDHNVKVWDAASGRELHSRKFPYRIQVVALDLRAGVGIGIVQPNQMTSPSLDIWDLATGEMKIQEPLPRFTEGYLAVSGDGRKLAVSGYDKARLWDLQRSVWCETHLAPEGVVAFSPDGRRLLVGERVQTLSAAPSAILEFPPGEAVQIISRGHEGRVQYRGYKATGVSPMALSPDGKRLAGGLSGEDYDGVAISTRLFASTRHLDWGYLYDPATQEPLFPLIGHRAPIHSLIYSIDGTRLVSGSEDNTVIIREAATGQPLHVLTGFEASVAAVALSANGHRVATSETLGVVKIWDARSGNLLYSQPTERYVVALAFSPDGDTLAVGGMDQVIRLWNVQTGREESALDGYPEPFRFLEFSPDGRFLLEGGQKHGIYVRALTGADEPVTLWGQSDLLSAVGWGLNGTQVITGDSNGEVRLWDRETGGLTLTLKGHDQSVILAAFLPDERTLLTGSTDGVLHWWHTRE